VGLEHAYFKKPCGSCDRYATWYRHYIYKDGWTLDREPIGHPLGGNGDETLLYARWDDPRRPLRLEARTFVRVRGRFNIYSPAREGHSTGGELSAVYRTRTNLDVLLSGSLEDGRRWTESSLFAGVRWIF
jgi:Capsule assembly protein Wzi